MMTFDRLTELQIALMLNSCPKGPSGQPFPSRVPSGSPSSTAFRVLRVIGTYHWHVPLDALSLLWCLANGNSLDDHP